MAITPFSPNISFMQGINTLKNEKMALEANQMQLDKAKQQQKDTEEASLALRDYYKTGNQESLINATLKSPELAGNMLKAVGLVDEQQKQSAAADAATLWQVADSPELFHQTIAKRTDEIMRKGGDPTQIIQLGMMYDKDPSGAKQQLRAVAAGLEAQGYKTGVFSTEEEKTPQSQREFEYYQQLKKQNPEAAAQFARGKGYIETGREENRTEAQRNLSEYQRLMKESPELAKQFGQSVGLVSKEGKELSAQTQKRLSEFTDAAMENQNLEQKYSTLADDFSKAALSGGVNTTWSEWIKEQTGNQDEISGLRREFFKIRGSEVVKNLPAGAASDADVALALAGFPSDKASGEQIASFLRGLAKLKAKERELNEFKASYISEKGTERGMLDAWKESQKQKSSSGNVVDWGSLN